MNGENEYFRTVDWWQITPTSLLSPLAHSPHEID